MLKIVSILALFLLLPHSALAQSERVADGKFIIISSALVGSTIFDLKSTFYFLDNCPINLRCRETNTLISPLVNRGRLVTYSVLMAVDAGAIAYSYHLKRDNNRIWWLVPLAMTAMHSYGGVHNYRIALSWR
ncbi:MAG: hypothetical protein HYT62_02760 [Candidatus Yanofskybacteria bacterium]|nr:hypothetical protein [Candidatus Yanofskybacteria bacterium]